MPRDMSWLSPKRRRTTTALPTVNSAVRKNGVENDHRPLSPSPRFTSPKPVLPAPSLKQRPSRALSSTSITSNAQGNMLGDTSGSNSSVQIARDEPSRSMMEGTCMFEERFEKMMKIVEENTQHISMLAEARSNVSDVRSGHGEKPKADVQDKSELSTHLDRITHLLEQNSAHVAGLAQRQAENEQRMRELIEAQHAREAREQPDMSQLTAHLDRIQKLMERTAHGRKDSARDIRASPPKVDLSPLTFWLEKVLSAVEQNSELVRELLQERQESRSPPSSQQIELDLSPLSQRLDDLLDAQEAKATRDQDAYTQMNQRLDKILEAQHKAVERGPFDVSLLSQRLDEILSVHRDVATATLTEPLEAIREASEQNSNHLLHLLEAYHDPESEERVSRGFEPLTEQLEALRTTAEQNNAAVIEILESLSVGQQAVADSSSTALTPFDDRVSNPLERNQEGPGIGDSKFLLSALTSHLSRIQAVTESNANAVRSTRESSSTMQQSLTAAVSETSGSVRTLAAKHKDLAAQVAVREGQVREVVRSQADMVECVRELAKSVKAQQEKATCNHVVIPPPRKTNRKVVGFVYDAKDGGRA